MTLLFDGTFPNGKLAPWSGVDSLPPLGHQTQPTSGHATFGTFAIDTSKKWKSHPYIGHALLPGLDISPGHLERNECHVNRAGSVAATQKMIGVWDWYAFVYQFDPNDQADVLTAAGLGQPFWQGNHPPVLDIRKSKSHLCLSLGAGKVNLQAHPVFEFQSHYDDRIAGVAHPNLPDMILRPPGAAIETGVFHEFIIGVQHMDTKGVAQGKTAVVQAYYRLETQTGWGAPAVDTTTWGKKFATLQSDAAGNLGAVIQDKVGPYCRHLSSVKRNYWFLCRRYSTLAEAQAWLDAGQ